MSLSLKRCDPQTPALLTAEQKDVLNAWASTPYTVEKPAPPGIPTPKSRPRRQVPQEEPEEEDLVVYVRAIDLLFADKEAAFSKLSQTDKRWMKATLYLRPGTPAKGTQHTNFL